jgi:hypothetical protein
MRTIFPSFTAAEESEFKDLSDKKFSNTIDNSESERLVFLGSKKDIDIFIENMIEIFSYQSSAKNGDILGYLFAVDILEESHWSNLAVSLKISELKSVGEISK